MKRVLSALLVLAIALAGPAAIASDFLSPNPLDYASWKMPVRAATTANITLSGTQTVDTVVLAVGDRVLVKNQATGANNGIYLVQSAAWTRTTDANSASNLLPGTAVVISEGGQAGQHWACTTFAPIVLGTTSLTFANLGGGGGAPSGPAGGDLAGSYPNPTLAAAQTHVSSIVAPAATALTLTGNAASSWTVVGAGVTIDANTVTIGGTTANPVSVGRAGIPVSHPGGLNTSNGQTSQFGGALVKISPVTATALTVNTNNWAPAVSTANRVHVDIQAAINVTGLVAQADGFTLEICNIDATAANIATLTHQDALSTAANRWCLPNNASVALRANGCVRTTYSTTGTCWRVMQP